jgi:hypothetical protein
VRVERQDRAGTSGAAGRDQLEDPLGLRQVTETMNAEIGQRECFAQRVRDQRRGAGPDQHLTLMRHLMEPGGATLGRSGEAPVGVPVGVTGRERDPDGSPAGRGAVDGRGQGLAGGREHLGAVVGNEKGHRSRRDETLSLWRSPSVMAAMSSAIAFAFP